MVSIKIPEPLKGSSRKKELDNQRLGSLLTSETEEKNCHQTPISVSIESSKGRPLLSYRAPLLSYRATQALPEGVIVSPGRVGFALQESRGRPVGEPWWGYCILALFLVQLLSNILNIYFKMYSPLRGKIIVFFCFLLL